MPFIENGVKTLLHPLWGSEDSQTWEYHEFLQELRWSTAMDYVRYRFEVRRIFGEPSNQLRIYPNEFMS